MNDHIKALLWETHAEIEAATLDVISSIGSEIPRKIAYPPGRSDTK